jgi:hypothetical protein
MPHIKELKQLLSGYFSFSRHGVECLAYFIFGILTVRTVNLSKIANSCGSPAKSSSIFRRFQRLIKHLKPCHKQLFNMIESVFKLEGKLTLCLDRTNWKLGKVHINYLVISIAYNGTAIPVIWSLLTDKNVATLILKIGVDCVIDYGNSWSLQELKCSWPTVSSSVRIGLPILKFMRFLLLCGQKNRLPPITTEGIS